MRSLLAIIGITVVGSILMMVLLITARLFIEARYLPTEAMLPTFAVNDRLLIEKIKTYLRRPYVRGEVIVFYPPPGELNGQDLSGDAMYVLGRLTGLPFLPDEPAMAKRVIGLPRDRIGIVHGQGVFVNGQRLNEASYIKEAPNYDLNVLADIGGRNIDDTVIRPYGDMGDARNPIVVPADQLFVLGDNRNNSQDSHIFGMVKQDRVIGRVQVRFFPSFKIIELPMY